MLVLATILCVVLWVFADYEEKKDYEMNHKKGESRDKYRYRVACRWTCLR